MTEENHQLTSTNINENVENEEEEDSPDDDPYSILEDRHKIAIDMVLEGFRYRNVAKGVFVEEQTVRKWFMKGGKCYAGYNYKKELRDLERKERFSDIQAQLEDLAADSIVVYKHALGHNKWKAAESILDRAGFQPIQKVQDLTPTKAVVIINRPNKDQNESDTSGDRLDDSGVPVQSDSQAG